MKRSAKMAAGPAGAALAFLLGVLAGLPAVARADQLDPLVLERTIALKAVTGRIDHMAIDLGRRRLFVAELGNGTVDAVDLAKGAVVRRLVGLKEPQGVAYVPGADVLAVASAGDGSVRLFRGAELTPGAVLDLGDDADNVRVDPATGNLIVGYGEGGLAVIDPLKASIVRRIPLPAHPEGFQLDAGSRRAFVNLPDGHAIAVVDVDRGQPVGSWRMPGFSANFPMALHDARAAVVFRSPARLVIFDREAGRVVSSTEACGDADDVFFDTQRPRVYVSCGDGTVDVWATQGPAVQKLGSVKTASGARTSLFVPEMDRLFVAARAGFFGLAGDAAVLVLRPAD